MMFFRKISLFGIVSLIGLFLDLFIVYILTASTQIQPSLIVLFSSICASIFVFILSNRFLTRSTVLNSSRLLSYIIYNICLVSLIMALYPIALGILIDHVIIKYAFAAVAVKLLFALFTFFLNYLVYKKLNGCH